MVDVQELVNNINSLCSRDMVSAIKVDEGYLIRENRSSTTPSMSILSEKDAVSHLTKLYNKVLKSLDKNIQVSKFQSYEVWFEGNLLGIYWSDSFLEACIKAGENIGLDVSLIYEEYGKVCYRGKLFSPKSLL